MRTRQRFILFAATLITFATAAMAANAESLAPPVIAPLSAEVREPVSTSSRTAHGGIIATREGRLATTATLIVFAFLIAGLGPNESGSRDLRQRRGGRSGR